MSKASRRSVIGIEAYLFDHYYRFVMSSLTVRPIQNQTLHNCYIVPIVSKNQKTN